MRNGNARQVVELLHCRGSPVGKEQHQSRGNRCGCNAQGQVAGGGIYQRSGKCEVPEVPDINVQGFGHSGCQQDNIH